MASVRSWRTAILLAAIALTLEMTSCGGGSSKSSRTAVSSSPSQSSAPGTPATAVATGPVRARLVCANHAPKVGKGWPYSVHVSDASGRPLSGSVDIEFTFAGQVVGRDSPPTHPIKNGLWHDVLTFPRASLGYQLLFQTVVHTKLGSVTLGCPVKSHS